MEEVCLVGIDHSTNKKSIVSLDSTGKVKVDETGALADMVSEMQLINTQGVKSNLAYLRSQGKCYVVNGTGTTGTSDTNYYMLSLYNPTGSGKTIYVYGGDFSLNGSGLTSGYFQLQIKSITTRPTVGASKTAANLKLDGGSASAELLQNATIAGGTNIHNSRQVNSNDAGDLDYHQNIILFNEMVEIPEGYGVTLNGFRSASNNVYFYYNVRFIEA